MCGLVMVGIWVLRDGRTRALCVEARCDLGVGMWEALKASCTMGSWKGLINNPGNELCQGRKAWRRGRD